MGIQWHNLGVSPVPGDPYSFATAMGLLLLDASLYGLATWYIEGVFPGERGAPDPSQPPRSPSPAQPRSAPLSLPASGQYGVPKPWNFPFLKSYWFGEPPSAGHPPFPTDPLTAPQGEPLPAPGQSGWGGSPAARGPAPP